MKSSRRITAGLALLLIAAGCDTTGAQDQFAEEASRPPDGITETNESGEVISEDADDWRTAPIYHGEIRFGPARPNPVAADEFVTIDVNVIANNSVRPPLRAEVLRHDGLLELDRIDGAGDFGAYIFNFSAAQLGSAGLHRVYVFDGIGEIVSYGDIRVL